MKPKTYREKLDLALKEAFPEDWSEMITSYRDAGQERPLERILYPRRSKPDA